MKQKIYFLLSFFWITIMSFGQVLDQSNWTTSTGTNFTIQQSTNQGKVGQSFQANVSGSLAQIKVDINVGVPTSVDFAIYEGSGDSGALLATTPLSFASSFFGEYTIDTSSLGINMVQGSSYTIVFSNSNPDMFSWVYTSNDLYASGEAFLSTNGSPFSSFSGIDMRFKTFVTPLVAPIPATHLNFDGVDDYVSIPNETAFDFTNKFTVEFWIKASVLPSYRSTVVSKGNTWGVHITNDGKIYVNAIYVQAISNTNVVDGNWHHIAAKLNGSLQIFVDGVQEQNTNASWITLDNNSYNVAIGGNLEQINDERYFNGNIDDLRIWSEGRTNGQITNSRFCELQGNETGLLAYYKFNQGFDGHNNAETILLNDDSTNSYNGSFNNMALYGTSSNFLSGSIVTTGITIPAAPAAQTQVPCLYTAADLTPAPSSTVKWYYDLNGDYSLSPSDELFSYTYYYSVLNANGCESERTAVTISVIEMPQAQYIVGFPIGSTATPLTAVSGGTGLLWYTTPTGGTGSTTAPTPDTSTLGSTYYWVSSTNDDGCESGRFPIEVVITPPPPANDECSGSISLTVGSSVTSNPVAVTLEGATDSSSAPSPDCGGYEGGDVWFTAVVPVSGSLTVETFGLDNWDTVLEVYSGDCTSLVYLDCNDNGNNNDDFSKVTISNLTPGENVYIRVWEYDYAFSSANFQISAYYVPPPANDDCLGNISLTVGTSVTSNAVTVNLSGATDSSSAPDPDCASYDGGDLWYSVIVPASGSLTIEAFGNDEFDTGLEVYTGDCTSLVYQDCDDDGGVDTYSKLNLSGLTVGETLYIRIWEYSEANSSAIFQLSAYNIPNDECSGSISLTVGSSVTSNPVAVSLHGATDSSSAPYPDCGGYDGGDVWFTAVVPVTGNLTVETFGLDNWDTVLEVYSGDCSSLTLLDCNDNDNNDDDFSRVTLPNLTPGENVYIRVWEYYEADSSADFQISAYSPDLLSNDSFDSNSFAIYPNPTTSNVNIKVDNLTNVKLQVFDVNGRVLINTLLNNDINNVNTNSLPTGIYFFKLTSDEGSFTSKVVKN